MPSRNLVQHHGILGAHGPEGGRLFASVPMTLARDGKLSAYAKAVAMFVWSHDEKWQLSAASIGDAIGMDRGTVSKALAELQEHGWFVREIHRKVGPSGKARTVWERWHVQMTNRPFTPDEIRELSAPEDQDVRATPAPSDGTCGPHPHGGAGQTRTGGAGGTRTIVVQSGVHTEVHSSSAREDQDEPDPSRGRSLAAAVERQAAGPDSDPWGGSTSEPASAGGYGQSPSRPSETSRLLGSDAAPHRARLIGGDGSDYPSTVADIHSQHFRDADDPFAAEPANQKEPA